MKISEMTNDQAVNALVRLAVPFGNICDDEQMVKTIEKFTKTKGVPMIRLFGKMIPDFVALALKGHKDDFYEIIGALTEKDRDTVAQMNFLETIKVFRDSYDEVLKDFFTSSMSRTKNAEKSP